MCSFNDTDSRRAACLSSDVSHEAAGRVGLKHTPSSPETNKGWSTTGGSLATLSDPGEECCARFNCEDPGYV
ncbi:hypothetical protein AOLI_G00054330 [Acnodon oligacanthus]